MQYTYVGTRQYCVLNKKEYIVNFSISESVTEWKPLNTNHWRKIYVCAQVAKNMKIPSSIITSNNFSIVVVMQNINRNTLGFVFVWEAESISKVLNIDFATPKKVN